MGVHVHVTQFAFRLHFKMSGSYMYQRALEMSSHYYYRGSSVSHKETIRHTSNTLSLFSLKSLIITLSL